MSAFAALLQCARHIVYSLTEPSIFEWKWYLRRQALWIIAWNLTVGTRPWGVRLFDAFQRNSCVSFASSCIYAITTLQRREPCSLGHRRYGSCQTQFHIICLTRRKLSRVKDQWKPAIMFLLYSLVLISTSHLAFPEEAWQYHREHVEGENLTMFV